MKPSERVDPGSLGERDEKCGLGSRPGDVKGDGRGDDREDLVAVANAAGEAAPAVAGERIFPTPDAGRLLARCLSENILLSI